MIKMAELKKVFEGLGLNSVQTYIQSGNVLFRSDEKIGDLRTLIESGIEEGFGFKVDVILRTAAELREIVAGNPFSQEEIDAVEALSDKECMYVGMLQDKPALEGIERLSAYQNDHDKYVIKGAEIYLLFDQSVRNSKLANSLHKLGVPVTVRNWKTMNKLVALVQEMENQK